MRALTWYPGTVLPHASLWHTLMRATWLNDLRAGDIRSLAGPRQTQEQHPWPRKQSTAQLKAVAKALGEPPNAFGHYATVAQFPPVVFTGDRMARTLRWCPECLAEGFHTLLGSIKLLSRCPVHGGPLLSACPTCGDTISMRLGGLAIRQPSCRCGFVRLIEAETVRQPSLDPTHLQVWRPVVRWLHRLQHVGFPIDGNLDDARRQAIPAERWCRDLGIDYPECFDTEARLPSGTGSAVPWAAYRASSGDLRAAGHTKAKPVGHFRSDQPSLSVYGAMARHLRRHGLPNPDRWILPLMRSLDPATHALWMAQIPKARIAFTELLWTRQLEPTAIYRRWPNRDASSPFSTEGGVVLRHTSIRLAGHALQIVTGRPLLDSAHSWVAYHAMAMEARLAWDRAQQQTYESLESGWADWGNRADETGSVRPAGVLWFCRAKGRGMTFVGYRPHFEAHSFSTGAPPKQERIDTQAQALEDLRRQVQALAYQPCLGWSDREGWHVARGAPPDDAVRRVRLLHTGQRTFCWIFRSSGLFVARLVKGDIQVVATTAREALGGLRIAVRGYRDRYDALYGLQAARHTGPKQLTSQQAEAVRLVQLRLEQVRQQDYNFWRFAGWICKGQPKHPSQDIQRSLDRGLEDWRCGAV